MRVALVQMNTGKDLSANLRAMEDAVGLAASNGARLIAFPEMAYFYGPADGWTPLLARYEELLATFRDWARHHRIHLLPGSLREPAGEGRYYNTLPAIGPDGRLLAAYRKIFLFRANLPDRVYHEGRHCEAGDTLALFEADGLIFGLSICYDLRFPELFRALRKRGAQAIVLPASFTVPTGTAHWEILLRARAIENQVFVLAPAQTGENGDRARTYGHSLAIAPWGEKLAERETEAGILYADLDPARIAEAAARVDAWGSRREDLFPIG